VRLRAVTAIAPGLESNEVAGTPRSVPTAPYITAVYDITHSDGWLRVEFNLPDSDNGAKIIRYAYSVNDGPWITWSLGDIANTKVIKGLPRGIPASVRIRAINMIGNGEISNTVVGTPYTAPSAPVLRFINSGDQSLTLQITAPTSNGGFPVQNYEYSLNGGDWTAASPATSVSPVVITGLTNGVTYDVSVRAVSIGGASPSGRSLSGTPATTPSAPVITGVTAGNRGATLAFTAPTSTGGAEILNYAYSIDGGVTWKRPGSIVTSSPLGIGGLVNGRTYSVQIRAINRAGLGAISNTVTVTPVR
jgi:titin